MEIIILCMSEEKLKRIEQIKQDWADEVRKIDSDSEVKGLGQKNITSHTRIWKRNIFFCYEKQ